MSDWTKRRDELALEQVQHRCGSSCLSLALQSYKQGYGQCRADMESEISGLAQLVDYDTKALLGMKIENEKLTAENAALRAENDCLKYRKTGNIREEIFLVEQERDRLLGVVKAAHEALISTTGFVYHYAGKNISEKVKQALADIEAAVPSITNPEGEK